MQLFISLFSPIPTVPKTDYKTEADYEKLVRTSLQNFQTDYIDLFLIHWPAVSGLPHNSTENPKYRHAAWKALTKFKSQGLIRSIGVSNFLVRHLEDLKSASSEIPSVNQVEWHPRYHDDEVHDYCKKNNILLQAYSSLGSHDDKFKLRNEANVVSIATELGKSPSQVLLQWAKQKDIAIIPKASSKKHLDENIDLDFEIPADKMTVLDNFKQYDKLYGNPKNVI